MPKATAVWLIENTSLTFQQIADFCNMHLLEVQGLADGEIATNMRGVDPVANGQITKENLERAQNDPTYKLTLSFQEEDVGQHSAKKGKKARYTPMSRRQDRPNAILWLVKTYPELKDSQIIRLVGTTKNTIESIRDKSYWNYANLSSASPAILSLCSASDLEKEIAKIKKPAQPEQIIEDAAPKEEEDASLTPVDLPIEQEPEQTVEDAPEEKEDASLAPVDFSISEKKPNPETD